MTLRRGRLRRRRRRGRGGTGRGGGGCQVFISEKKKSQFLTHSERAADYIHLYFTFRRF